MRNSMFILISVVLFSCSTHLAAQQPDKLGPDEINGQNGVERKDSSRQKNQRSNGLAGKKSVPDPMVLFNRLDRNSDGKLTADEIPDRMQRRISQMDVNKDGSITRKELVAFLKRMPDSRNADGVQPGPKKNQAKPLRKPSSATMIKRIDRDSDGRISLDEAPEPMKEKFVRMDSNGDGFVDGQELESAMQKIKNGKTKNRYDTDPEGSKGQLPKRPPSDG